jgi:hypothetical protein
MNIPNEILLEIIKHCDFKTLISLRATQYIFKKLSNSFILDKINESININNREYNIKRREYTDFERFSFDELQRYNSFISCNSSDINEASWYYKPLTELYIVCHLLCILYGYYTDDWSKIRLCMKTQKFKKWYIQIGKLEFNNDSLKLTTEHLTHIFQERFVENLKSKSYIGHIIFINLFSSIQISLMKAELDNLEEDFIKTKETKISLNHFIRFL